MNARLRLALAFAAGALPVLLAAEDAPKSSAREALRARVAEDAKKADAKAGEPAATEIAAAADKASPAPVKGASGPLKASATDGKNPPKTATTPETPPPAKQPATVLPKVEVKKGRITELDLKIAQQEKDIAREQKNTKSTELDTALNDAKVARPLAIFGGDSTQFRKGVANQRVELMEAEKDILEAMAQAKTKEEKAALQTQLDQIKAMRRELDKTMR